MKSGIFSLGKQTIIYGLGDAFYKAVAFFLLPVYLKYLDPGAYGTIESLMVTRGLIVTLIAMGLPNAVFRFYYRAKDEGERKTIISTIFFISLGAQILGAGLFLWKNEWISSLVLKSPEYGFFFAILAVNIFFIGFRGIPMALFRAQERAIAYTVLNLTVSLVTLIMNIYFVAYLEKGVLGVLYGNLCGGGAGLIMVFPILCREIRFTFNPGFIRKILGFSVPLGVAVIPMTIIFMADRYFIIRLDSLRGLGIYALGYKIGSILKIFVVMPFMLAWGPFVFAKEHDENVKDIYSVATRYFVIIGLIFVVAISLFQIDLIKILTENTEYFPASEVVPLICYAFFFYGLSGVIRGVGVRITGKTYYTTGIMTFGMCLNLIMNYFLIKWLGYLGAAYSLLITFVVILVFSYVISIKLYYVDYKIGKALKMIFASGIIVAFSQLPSVQAVRFGFMVRMCLLIVFCLYILCHIFSIDQRKAIALSVNLQWKNISSSIFSSKPKI